MRDFLTLTEAAQRIGCPPKKISDLIYCGRVDVARTQRLGNARLIEKSYLPALRQIVKASLSPRRKTATAKA